MIETHVPSSQAGTYWQPLVPEAGGAPGASVGWCSPADVPAAHQVELGGGAASLAPELYHRGRFHPVQRSPEGFLAGTQRNQQEDLSRMTDPTPWNASPAQFMVHNYIQ